jgi:hypothetical protein
MVDSQVKQTILHRSQKLYGDTRKNIEQSYYFVWGKRTVHAVWQASSECANTRGGKLAIDRSINVS